jgi:uncharacterized protein YbjT (DUF2867 family)
MSILVTTPTGNIGSRVTARLIEERADVSVFARKPDALPEGVRAHATVHQGDLNNTNDLIAALEGADALFFLIPPNMQTDAWRDWQRQIAKNAAEAIRQTGVDRAVMLSSIGAQRDDMGPISGLGDGEEILAEVVPNLVRLRAGYFMENFLQFAGSIAAEGAIYHAFPPEKAMPTVATVDIGNVAAELLMGDSWGGDIVRGVHGPTDLSHGEAAEIIGEALGQDVSYVQVPVEAVQGQMREMGLTDDVVANYGEMITGLTDMSRDEIEPRTDATTTATTLHDFAQRAIAPAVEGATKQMAAQAK